MENLNNLRDLDALKISLASPDEILSWSYGEVTKPETINYRTFKPERDGLFCERIFGPVKDYECACGKYKRVRFKGVVCDRCGVQVTSSKVRRERMGHIKLVSPVAHVWYFKNIPSVLATLLGIPPRSLELVIYFSSFIVTDIDYDAKEKVLEQFDELANEARETAGLEIENQISEIYENTEAKIKALSKDPEDKWDDKLKKKAEEIRKLAEEQIGDLRNKQLIEQEKAELEIRKIEKKLKEVELHTIMTDREYVSLEEYLDEFCEVSIGAEAIEKILADLDVKALEKEVEEQIETAKSSQVDKLKKRLRVIKSFINGEVDPKNMIIEVLPVIPPDLRPMVQLEGGRFAASDLNDLYRRIINRNNRLKRLLDLGAPDIIIRNEKRMLQESVDALIDSSKVRKSRTRERKTYRSIADTIKGKQGYFRANLLGKRVDYSGRSVIVSGPSLRMHECGLPVDIAFELFRPFLLREIMARGLAPNMKTAKRVLEERSGAIYDILEELVKTRPVLLNRAPTLHKLSIQAFYPKLVHDKAIQLHPVVCAGFNADFDGDQMAVHLPLSEEAVMESIELMLSTNNLLKPANGEVITVPSKEMLLGIYYLTSINPNFEMHKSVFADESEVFQALGNDVIEIRQKIRYLKGDEIIETSAGRIIFNSFVPDELGFVNEEIGGKSGVKKLVKEALEKVGVERTIDFIDDLKKYGFIYSTKSGVSLSIFDTKKPADMDEVLKKAKEEVSKIEQNYYMGLITRNEMIKLSFKVWKQVENHFDETILSNLEHENPVNIIIRAKAGKASAVQIRQIAALKGLIADPKGKVIELPVIGNYANGLSSFDYFLSARGVRKNYMDKGLGTADAGYLTRRLVNVAQDILVREEDCGTKNYRTVKRDDNTTLVEWNDRVVGRYAAETIKDKKGNVIVKRNELITEDIAKKIGESDVEEVKIRSVLTCESEYGVCTKCYGLDLSYKKDVAIGAAVGIMAAQSIGEPGTQLTMRTFHSGGIAQSDITQGLPRIDELFEARKPKNQSIMTHIAGKVVINEEEDKLIVKIVPTKKEDLEEVYELDKTADLAVNDGDLVAPGDQITQGARNLQEMYETVGEEGTKEYILNEVQKTYASQGVEIDDKHVEAIIRQMFNRVKIIDTGDTKLLPGDIVTIYKLREENEKAVKKGGQEATYEKLLLGISKVSINSESWLDAASFEETSRVLTERSIAGSIDKLIGLKENVIIGRRIPVGEAARLKKEEV